MTQRPSPPSSNDATSEQADAHDSRPSATPPVAERRTHSSTNHGVSIEDPWHWLRDPGYPQVEDVDVLEYLKAENEYFEASMRPHRELVEAIFEEIKGRQQPDLSSVPWRRGDWYYQWSFQDGSQYRVWQRWPASGPERERGPTADALTILDEPELAKDLEYFRLGSASVSNGGSLLAYSTDVDGVGTIPDGGQGPGDRGAARGRIREPWASRSGPWTTHPFSTPWWMRTGGHGR